jgi:hypothetical protein
MTADVMFHAAPSRLADRVAVNGLVPGAATPTGVYFWYEPDEAAEYYDGTVLAYDLYQTDVTGLDLLEDPWGPGNAAYVAAPIEPWRLLNLGPVSAFG